MRDTSVDIIDLLAFETSPDCSQLIKILAFDQASQLSLLKHLFNLTEWEFNSIVFRRVRYDPYPLNRKLSH